MDRRSYDDIHDTKATLYNTTSLVDRPKAVNFNHLPGFRQGDDSVDHTVLQKLLEDVSGTPILNSLEKMMQQEPITQINNFHTEAKPLR